MQTIVKNKLLSSVILLVLGVLLMIAPEASRNLYIRIIGVVLLCGALVRIVTHLQAKKEDRAPISMVLGVAAGVIALFFLLFPGVVTNILAYVFGVILILNSLLDLVIAVRLPSGKLIAVLLALIGLLLGVLIVVNPTALANAIVYIIGGALIYESVVGIVSSLLARKTAKSNLLNK